MKGKRFFLYCLISLLCFITAGIILHLFLFDHLKINNDTLLILSIIFFLANLSDCHSTLLAVKLIKVPEIEINPLWRAVIRKPKIFFFTRVIVLQLALIYVPGWLILQAPLLGSPAFLHPYWFPRVEAGMITAFSFIVFCMAINNYLQSLRYLILKRRWRDKLKIAAT